MENSERESIKKTSDVAIYVKKEDVTSKVSNVILKAKYKTTYLEHKVLHISLARISESTIDKETGAVVSSLDVSTIQNILGIKGNSIYGKLKKVAKQMTSQNIGFSNPKNNNEFVYLSLYLKAECKNGKFKIYYNPYLKDYIVDIKTNYTKLLEKISLSFKSLHTALLYKELKQRAFEPGEKIKEESRAIRTYHFEYNLAELLIDLGFVNANAEEVMNILDKSQKPDYEKAVTVAKEKKYEEWGEFQRSVLRPAVDDINEKADIRVSYEPIKKGRGGKVKAILFTVDVLPIIRTDLLAEEEEEVITITDEEKDEYIDWLSDLIETPLKIKDLRSIAEEAGYSQEKAQKAYEILKYTPQVDNVVGFMISAIRNNYSSTGGSQGQKRKKESTYTDFPQHDYDFEALEKEILSN